MSRLYDTVEPSVIDEDMLQHAVEEQGPKNEAGRIAKLEGIDFAEVTTLRLDFKNILKIDNLWQFKNLVKLQLDNNIIEKIEGLDILVNLVWLDLSFNNIEVIDGLRSLTKLEDLTLYNNRISRLENMDALEQLHVVSIGNNSLNSLENLIYLRRFKNLQTINLAGNPFCEDTNYKPYVVAHIPSLVYLDFRLIDDNTRAAAMEQYRYAIEELVVDETSAERKRLNQEAKDKEFSTQKFIELDWSSAPGVRMRVKIWYSPTPRIRKLDRWRDINEAYVENLNGPYLFDTMFEEDPDASKLAALPGVDELLLVYKDKMVSICQQVFAVGLKEHERRQKEVEEFYSCVDDAKKENKVMAIKNIGEFKKYKKKVFEEIHMITDNKMLDTLLREYSEDTSQLWDELMGLELQLVDQLEDTIKEFERNMADMVAGFVEHVQGLISQTRDLENAHHEKQLEIAIVTLEKYVKNELDTELPEDLRLLLIDKDTITNAVSASHDTHMLKIDNREDDIIQRANGWLGILMETIHQQEEVTRNRDRVKEINNFIDHIREEIDNLDLPSGM